MVDLERRRIRITGVVQGVGFRPFAFAEADARGITGFIGNDTDGVFGEIQGSAAALHEFTTALEIGPRMSRVEILDWAIAPVQEGESDFRIVDSGASSGTTSLPPDTAVCDACLAEMHDPDNRRYRYPFIACTHCGPRYTIVTGLPYDRPFTTMQDFPLCAQCQAEYDDPTDRRFHAQPTACWECGPRLRFIGSDGEADDDAALAQALETLAGGGIVAIKGVGGYHLAVDALKAKAVQRLRERKGRGDKPFAVMAADLSVARSLVTLDEVSERRLTSYEAPIVLAPAGDLALRDHVAPHQDRIGVMLPYAPV